MIDLLPSRGPKAFGQFVEILKEDYDWLADYLESELPEGESEVDSGPQV